MSLLEEAKRIVEERTKEYGPPEHSFEIIGQFWTVYLRNRGVLTRDLESFEVAMLLKLLKTARLTVNPIHPDSQVDVMGYMDGYNRCVNKSFREKSVKSD